MKKRLISLFLVFALVIFGSMNVFADTEITGKIVPEDSALSFAEARAKGIQYDIPLHQKTYAELIREGYQFYGGTVSLNSYGGSYSPKATTTGVLGYITASGNTTVYSGKGTGTNLGYVTFREIVYVSSISGNYAYVKFKNANSVLKYGYIPNSAVYSPAYGWSTPVTSGKITQYYGDTTSDPNGHTGIDVGGHGSSTPSVYATYAGTASFRETTKQTTNGTKYFANYGKHIRLTTGSYEVIYAHLSSFGQNVSSNSYSSEGYPVPSNLAGLQTSTSEIASKSVTKGATIGSVGNTGKSSGKHLHFEVRVNGVIKDPFTYVVFPNVSWAQ